MQPEWVDDFLFIDFMLVTILIFLDWVIGKDHREKIKESVAEWYIYLEDTTYGQLIAEDAKKVHDLLVRYFGNSTFSKKRFFSSLLASLIITIVVLVFFYILLISELESSKIFKTAAYSVLIPNMLTDWLSLSVSILLLDWMTRKSSMHRYVAIIIIDTLLVVMLLMLAIVMTVPIINQFQLMPHRFFGGSIDGGGEYMVAGLVILCTAVLPTLLHVIYAIYLVLSKVTGSTLRGPVSLVTLRVYECEKGVLTQLSIGLGVSAKLIQETIKYAG